jgi:hypothetical protein
MHESYGIARRRIVTHRRGIQRPDGESGPHREALDDLKIPGRQSAIRGADFE